MSGSPAPSVRWDGERRIFAGAAEAFVDLAGRIAATSELELPALGGWTVRELLGHTGRALVTVARYARPSPSAIEMEDAAAYFVAASGIEPSEIHERGREAGAALGSDPTAALRESLGAATEALRRTAPDHHFATAVGTMAPADYLRTRTFELVVHSGDLARATGLDAGLPEAAVRAALELTVEIALRLDRAEDALAWLTGREVPRGSVLDLRPA